MSDPEDRQRAPAGPEAGRPVPELLGELWELVRAYVRQETVEPVRGVGRYVAFGVAGAALIGAGVVLLAVGGLRVLQDETTLGGNLSWIPYLVVVAVLAAGAALSLAAIGRRRSSGDRRERAGRTAPPEARREGTP